MVDLRGWAILIAAFGFLSINSAKALTYYSRTNGNWTNSAIWSTVSFTSTINAGTYPGPDDDVYIGNTHTVLLNTTPLYCKNLNIGAGISGRLRYDGSTTFTLNILGNVAINPGATWDIRANGFSGHAANITGNVINNGTIDFKNTAAAGKTVYLRLVGSSNTVIAGAGNWFLENWDMDKDSRNFTVEIANSTFASQISSPNPGFLGSLLVKGTLILNTNATINYLNNTRYQSIAPTANVNDFDIHENLNIKVMQGTLNLAGGSDYKVNLKGGLEILGGTVNIGGGSGTAGGLIYSSASSTPSIKITGGTLNVYGAIFPLTITDGVSFMQGAGSVYTGSGTASHGSINFHINDVAGSYFQIDGGTINIQRGTAASNSFNINGTFPSNVKVNGGMVVFGNSATSTVFRFMNQSGITYPHIKISGASGTNLSAMFDAPFSILSLYIETGNLFDCTAHPTSTFCIKSRFNDYAFHNNGTLISALTTACFCGSADQYIKGNTNSGFYNLCIENSSAVILGQSQTVNNKLILNSGALSLNGNTLYVSNTAKNAVEKNGLTSYVKSETNAASNTSILKWKLAADTGAYVYPFGKSSSVYLPVKIVKHAYGSFDLSISTRATGSDNTPYATGTNMNSIYGGSAATVIDRWWEIRPSASVGTGGLDVTLSYEGQENTLGVDQSNGLLRAQIWNDAAAGWDFPSGDGYGVTAGTGTVTFYGQRAFSHTVISSAAGPLPVDLLTFTARKNMQQVICEWAMVQESNIRTYEILRSSDGINFSLVKKIQSSGRTGSNIYSVADLEPLAGESFYQLRLENTDGTVEYSNPELVSFFSSTSVYPNPASSVLFISGSDHAARVGIRSIDGKLVSELFDTKIIDLSGIAKGVYIVEITTTDGYQTKERIVRN